MSPRNNGNGHPLQRREDRYNGYVRNFSVVYECSMEGITFRAPDISPRGMFINTPNHLPEGAVLRVSFQLPRSNYEILARCEVRYCLPGVGIGVEFVDISRDAQRAIEDEIQLSEPAARPTA